MAEPQKITLNLSPQARRYASREAPLAARRMAARGALPLPPVELAHVLFALMHDPDAEVKSTARESLEQLPSDVMRTVVSGPTHPAVLSFLAQVHRDDAELAEQIALNPRTGDATLVFLAGLPHKRVVDIVANNQQRMLRCPEIVEALGANPLTGRAAIDRILSFLGLDRSPAEATGDPDTEVESPDLDEISDDAAAEALRNLLGEDASGLARELVEEHAEEIPDEQRTNLLKLVQTMNVMQKIKLARMGNKEARGLLVRDHNKIVATAAIRSPKLTENEVAQYAKMRNVCDDVLRVIANNREWTKNYQVKLALATNPKAPPSAAVKFLNYLQERDLRSIMRSKEVPAAVCTHARRILTKKGKL